MCKVPQARIVDHLQLAHNWSKASAQAAVGQHNMRKRKGESLVAPGGKKKYPHKQKICPLPDCYSTSKNIGEHLRSKKHSIFPYGETEVLYKKLVKEARHFDSKLVPETEDSPKKRYGIVSKKGIPLQRKNLVFYALVSVFFLKNLHH